jgi:ribA/ribD-fused uncharacterized protein
MELWTAQYRYPGPYRLDITVKGQDQFGKVFSPTWEMVSTYLKSARTLADQQSYIEKYHGLILNVINRNPEAWNKLLAMPQVVLVCFCTPGEFCHRNLLVYYLQKYGAKYNGEITDFSRWSNKPPDILEFKGDYSWLSNFAPCEFEYQGITYPTTEHFYQAWKFPADQRARIAAIATPRLTKREGRKAKLCWNWDSVRIEVMKTALEEKFKIDKFRNLLLSTSSAKLVEGNWWHDNFWGDCYCAKCKGNPGANTLGNMIMDIRSSL